MLGTGGDTGKTGNGPTTGIRTYAKPYYSRSGVKMVYLDQILVASIDLGVAMHQVLIPLTKTGTIFYGAQSLR